MEIQLLQIQGLHKAFGGVQALRNPSIFVRKGEIVGIIGPNGSGKTTLFNLITGITPPSAGAIYWNNGSELLNNKSVGNFFAWYRSDIPEYPAFVGPNYFRERTHRRLYRNSYIMDGSPSQSTTRKAKRERCHRKSFKYPTFYGFASCYFVGTHGWRTFVCGSSEGGTRVSPNERTAIDTLGRTYGRNE